MLQYQEQLRKDAELKEHQRIFASIMNGPNVGVVIPSAYDNLADLTEPVDPSDIPFFWHVPRSGGSTMKDLLTDCFGLVLASGLGKVPNDLTITVSVFSVVL